MGSGRVDVRMTQRTGKVRLRFYGVAPDQLDSIVEALNMARQDLSTDYDTVALEQICLYFLATHSKETLKKVPA